MITLYGRRNSSNVQRVIWALAELGVAHERLNVGGSFGGVDTAEYKARNPTGMVPTLQDGDLAIWESEAILRYLAAKYGEGSLWPARPEDRARGDRWLAWTNTVMAPAFSAVFFKTIRCPRAEQDLPALQPQMDRLNEAMAFFDRVLAGEPGHLAGEAFSYADIPPAILTYRYKNLPMTRPDLPALDAWYDRVSARPAFQEHVALPMGTCLEEWFEQEKALACA